MQSLKSSFVFSHLFNTYDLLLLTTFVLALFLGLALVMQRNKRSSHCLLAAFVMSQGFYAFYSVMLYNQNISSYTEAMLAPFHKSPLLILFGLQGLLLLWYTKSMIGEHFRINSPLSRMMLFLTALALTVNVYGYSHEQYQALNNLLCNGLLNLCSVIIGIQAMRKLQRFEITLPHVHSNIEKYSLSWLTLIAFGFVSVWMLSLLAVTLSWMGANDIAEAFYLFRHLPPLVLMSVMVVFSQSQALSNLGNIPLAEEGNQVEAETNNNRYEPDQRLTTHLEDLMTRVKLYQDPELRLDGLADSLGISPRSLSTLLNKHYKQSFYDFVNSYRIEDVRTQFRDANNKQKAVQRVFEDAGFNSKTTFNTLFKRYTGQTPSEYRRQVSAQLL